MEIEGLINHTLASALVERDYLAHKMQENRFHIVFWRSIQEIHANEEIKFRLKGVNHIRQILGSEEYMDYMVRQEPDEPLYFMGFPIKSIEFYLHLRQSNRLDVEANQEETLEN